MLIEKENAKEKAGEKIFFSRINIKMVQDLILIVIYNY